MWSKELGLTGERIAEVGLGTWDFRGGPEVLRTGFEAGAWFVHTAEAYDSEPVGGEAIRGSESNELDAGRGGAAFGGGAIPSHSPQARGRSERMKRTLQVDS